MDDVKGDGQKYHGHGQRAEERHSKVSLRKLAHGMCNQGGSRWPVELAVYPALRRWQVGPLLCSRANVVQSKFDQVAGAKLGIVANHDFGATPRPICKADGRKLPDCYTVPDTLRDRLTERLGPFPLFQFWGPATTIASTRWIADAHQNGDGGKRSDAGPGLAWPHHRRFP